MPTNSPIFDADCHISPTPERGVSITTDELLRRMDRAGVAKALTWLQPPYLRHVDAANRYVYDAARAHPDRIVGFGWADVALGLDAAKRAVSQCLDEFGFPGVKFNGAQNSFYIDSPAAIETMEGVVERGRILAFHCGGDAPETTHPFRVVKIARLFPETPILLIHIGGAAFHDLSDAAIEMALECPNITFIGSGVRAVSILKAIKAVGADRVCFGSDTPFAMMHVEVAMYNALMEGEVDEDGQRAIMGVNIARVLDIPF